MSNQGFVANVGSLMNRSPTQQSNTPSNGYVAEDDVTFYVAEDGSTFYVQE